MTLPASRDLTETVVASRQVYSGRIVKLRVDTVRLSDGKETLREIVEHRGAVCIVPFTADGDVLFVRQFRLATGATLLELPAGTLETGEAPEVCAARELEEETGFKAGALIHLFSAYVAPGYSTELVHSYLATDLSPCSAYTDEDEHLELVKLTMPDAYSRVLAGQFHDSKTISSLLVAREKLADNGSP